MLLDDGTELFCEFKHNEKHKLPVVLVHGDGQNHTVWTAARDYFLRQGHPTLWYDLPGHGYSEPYRTGSYSFERFVETLKQAMEEHGIMQCLIAGNSTGGMIALKHAAESPEDVKGVIAIGCCDTCPTRRTMKEKGDMIIQQYVEQSRKMFQKQELYDFSKGKASDAEIFEAAVRYTSPEAIEGNLKAVKQFDISSKLSLIKARVLLIRGSEDIIVTQEWAEEIARKMPSARLAIIEGYGHNVLLQSPERIVRMIDANYSFLMQR